MRNQIGVALALVILSVSAAIAADKVDWSPCKPEIEKFCKDVKDKSGEEALYQCLLKHDIDLSKTCDNEAHSLYEKLTGKQ